VIGHGNNVRPKSIHQDLNRLPVGILSPLGEGASNISGGQKARLALARSIYMEADL
jgi:ABC-type bacteriocin/lantibiotic exporter with double-glycine peptidase domain